MSVWTTQREAGLSLKQCCRVVVGKVFFALLTALAAGAVQAATMGVDDARHLLTRTGFGAQPAEIVLYAGLSREEGVARLLAETRQSPSSAMPARVTDSPIVPLRDMSREQRQAYDADQRLRTNEMRAWWLGEMLQTSSPLTERMTLFWHNHFVSSQQKVKHLALMRDQNMLLRSHAVGNFAALLHAVAKDPAMLIYLDAASNRRAQPNENFAREVMELFTLGEGHYGEADVKEAARAFTGWSVDPASGRFLFRKQVHDAGEKQLFGQRGFFDGDDVLDLLLARPETAEFIVGKLWREFISPQPDPLEVRRIASVFRDRGYAIAPVLQALLSSEAFWRSEQRGALIKSPVDLVVGSLHALQAEVPDAIPFTRTMRLLGQDLLAPPNARGWPGNEVWINTNTLLARKQFLDRLLRAAQNAAEQPLMSAPGLVTSASSEPMSAAVSTKDRSMAALREISVPFKAWEEGLKQLGLKHSGLTAERVLLAVPPTDPSAPMSASAALRSVLLDPAYQVK